MSTADLTRMHLATQNPEGGLEAAIESGGRASEAPTVTESTPAKLSDPVPQSVHRNAEDGKQVHTSSGKSERTLRRQKKERDEMDKFKAMVARVKAKLRALQGAKEEEARTESEMGDEDKDTLLSQAAPHAKLNKSMLKKNTPFLSIVTCTRTLARSLPGPYLKKRKRNWTMIESLTRETRAQMILPWRNKVIEKMLRTLSCRCSRTFTMGMTLRMEVTSTLQTVPVDTL
jgi:hypothetical protein